ncbi:mitogen-activated protein kinase kinase kinase 20-like [Anneissia japonica]|uniref:mitogen-activated protein kinase kinase kinase 20-like n=1 Tax=Anneissia japonica TaxID=1529436 RepID=UPI001425A72F|nr:mitogen-activated protein kinase kinase kinase 20-like [Anneissia japonica]XP_033106197.1 mitogen-activated protein kinase kinase kinase 20-like [Anneissia japonica]XP_033106198.1 mitogen-activated protein kinase kinase kinase 20-like [Anneissia japonica]
MKMAAKKMDLYGLSELQYDSFEFGIKIGKGSSGIVYEGRWKSQSDFPVAIKQLNNIKEIEFATLYKIKEDRKQKELFIGHHFITKVVGVIHNDGYYIVMEYVANGSLHSYLSNKREQQQKVDMKKFLTWTRQGAYAIQYLHSLDIIHRDIKSLNVLITNKDNLKICDFGISRITDETIDTTNSIGSKPWMAPENLEPNAKLSKRSDIYAYGVVIWEMWTCESPIKKRMDNWTYPLDDRTPTELQQLLLKCWEKERDKRPSVLEILEVTKTLARNENIDVQDFMNEPDSRPMPDGRGDVVPEEQQLPQAKNPNKRLTEKHLNNISGELRGDWEGVARSLGVTSVEIDHAKKENETIREKIFAAFNKMRKRKSSKTDFVRIGDVIKAFQEERVDISVYGFLLQE